MNRTRDGAREVVGALLFAPIILWAPITGNPYAFNFVTRYYTFEGQVRAICKCHRLRTTITAAHCNVVRRASRCTSVWGAMIITKGLR